MSFYIKNIKIKNKGLLAPMLEYTTLPFRLLSQKYGCALSYTEMVSINHINKVKDLSQISLLASTTKDKSAVQLVGDFTNQKDFFFAMHLLDSYKHFKIIDLNFGCPSLQVHNMNAGAILLSPNNFSKAVQNLKDVISTINKPTTVKTRLGYHKQITNLFSSFENANVSAISVHGRYSNQAYDVPSDYKTIDYLSKDISIPLIYNGDVNFSNVLDFLSKDYSALMVGRQALSNPFIFKTISKNKVCKRKQVKIIDDYLKICKKHPISFNKKKLALISLTNTIKNSSKFRNLISQSKTDEQLQNVLKNIK